MIQNCIQTYGSTKQFSEIYLYICNKYLHSHWNYFRTYILLAYNYQRGVKEKGGIGDQICAHNNYMDVYEFNEPLFQLYSC